MPASPKDTATIATLSVKLDGAITQINELKNRFDLFQNNFIRSDVYNIRHEELVRQVAINQKDIEAIKRNRWVSALGLVVMGGVLTFLTNYAITH